MLATRNPDPGSAAPHAAAFALLALLAASRRRARRRRPPRGRPLLPRLPRRVRVLPHRLPARHAARVLLAAADGKPAAAHFGTDASVDAGATAKAQPVAPTLHAATTGRAGEAPPQDRITRSAWFVREHRRVAPATWKLPAVKSAANCAACHTNAEQGNFDEHQVRIPR